MSELPAVEHDAAARKFFLVIDGQEAHLYYARRGDALDFHHVFVPPAGRGRGVAAALTQAGFDYARQAGLRVIATCPYVAEAFIPRNPQVRDLLVNG